MWWHPAAASTTASTRTSSVAVRSVCECAENVSVALWPAAAAASTFSPSTYLPFAAASLATAPASATPALPLSLGTAADQDSDGIPDCIDQCPSDPSKTSPGQCGCNVQDIDADGDGVCECPLVTHSSKMWKPFLIDDMLHWPLLVKSTIEMSMPPSANEASLDARYFYFCNADRTGPRLFHALSDEFCEFLIMREARWQSIAGRAAPEETAWHRDVFQHDQYLELTLNNSLDTKLLWWSASERGAETGARMVAAFHLDRVLGIHRTPVTLPRCIPAPSVTLQHDVHLPHWFTHYGGHGLDVCARDSTLVAGYVTALPVLTVDVQDTSPVPATTYIADLFQMSSDEMQQMRASALNVLATSEVHSGDSIEVNIGPLNAALESSIMAMYVRQ
eukprot:TRINITY_DN1355_c0_g2_i2.p1 TRINITY_DN1355_c0_g2~~TRINITY_DN1355_c0_g2_i2.p1  ORF type:complete len:391 (-),score=72.66 TRINITY_DN1355_c0_g2_i2:643-1815(-)